MTLDAGVSVDIMPGLNYLANFALPQQLLNICLFPGSAPYNTFRSCRNPPPFDVDNIRFRGTSDQNIDDLDRSEGQLVRLIYIPKFFETVVAVVVNLRNLKCQL
ncbi:hypothetical protein HID58_090538 [Brassica napus]|uniref:DNA polymerase alpha/delta/epsilon subunit B domain-containing protein n=1 Tax=Brassica napus TaxID=3708 RepID=A0ABQ7X072_BRANA|nr:hypothetical protein HID58_090538 [Brassica napus]